MIYNKIIVQKYKIVPIQYKSKIFVTLTFTQQIFRNEHPHYMINQSIWYIFWFLTQYQTMKSYRDYVLLT